MLFSCTQFELSGLKRNAKICFVVLLVFFAQWTQATSVSFQDDLMPTITLRCGACHITGKEPGNMALVPGRTWQSLVGQPSVELPTMLRISAGNPNESYVWYKLNGSHRKVGGSGVRMPMHQPPLPNAFMVVFEKWIEQGAPDN